MAGKSAAMQHGVTRAVIAFVLVFVAVLLGAGVYMAGSQIPGLGIVVLGVIFAALIWRDK